MTAGQRAILVLSYAMALSCVVGVLSLAFHLGRVWPGMVTAFAIGSFTGIMQTRSVR